MKKQLVITTLLIVTPFLFASCVSSLLKEKAPTFSDEIRIKDPANPFVRMSTPVYPSWKNTQTGNVISILSDCNENSTYSLSSLHAFIQDSLEQVKIVKEEQTALQNRPAVMKIIQAQLDGQPIEVQSISFKRKSCGYVSAISGHIGNLEKDRPQFEKFLNELTFQ